MWFLLSTDRSGRCCIPVWSQLLTKTPLSRWLTPASDLQQGENNIMYTSRY
ncbi:hypothetical protein FKM82_022382 [Ascaphus truei]